MAVFTVNRASYYQCTIYGLCLQIYSIFYSSKIFKYKQNGSWPVWRCQPRRWDDETWEIFLSHAEGTQHNRGTNLFFSVLEHERWHWSETASPKTKVPSYLLSFICVAGLKRKKPLSFHPHVLSLNKGQNFGMVLIQRTLSDRLDSFEQVSVIIFSYHGVIIDGTNSGSPGRRRA